MPTFTDPLREIDAASVKEYALQRGAAELSDDFVQEACQRVMELAKPQAICQQCFYDNTSHMVLCDSPFTISSPTACQRIEDSAIVLMYAVTLGEAVEHYRAAEPRGEYVLVMAGAPAGAAEEEELTLEQAAQRAFALTIEGFSASAAAKAAAQGTAYSKSEVYKQLLLLQQTTE